MQKKRQPGCPCCEPSHCVIATDAFATDGYYYESGLSSNWTLKNGDWNDISVSSEVATTDGAVELWHQTPHPDDPYPSDVRIKVRGAADSILRIIISASGDVATGNALIVELAPGAECGTLKLYQRQGGVEDVLATLVVFGAVVDEWHNLRACYDPETTVLTGSILPHDETNRRQISVEVEAHTDGASAGFASGTTDQSDFDSFIYRKLWWDEIITPLCAEIDATVPDLDVTLTTFQDDSIKNVVLDIYFYSGGVMVWHYSWVGTDTVTGAYLASLLNLAMVEHGDPLFDNVTVAGSGDSDSTIHLVFTDGDNVIDGVTFTIGFVGEAPWQTGAVYDELILTVEHEGTKQFKLQFGGEQTAVLSTDSSASTIQSALEGLSSIGSGNVSVTGNPGSPWSITLINDMAGYPAGGISAITELGDCRDYGTYYYDETVRHVCTKCARTCWLMGRDPSDYDDGPITCDFTVVDGTGFTKATTSGVHYWTGTGTMTPPGEIREVPYVGEGDFINPIEGPTYTFNFDSHNVTFVWTAIDPPVGPLFHDSQCVVSVDATPIWTWTGILGDLATERTGVEFSAHVCRLAEAAKVHIQIAPGNLSPISTYDEEIVIDAADPFPLYVSVDIADEDGKTTGAYAFRHASLDPDCYHCYSDCGLCDGDYNVPDYVTVDFGDDGPTVGTCDHCDDFTGEVALPSAVGNGCCWGVDLGECAAPVAMSSMPNCPQTVGVGIAACIVQADGGQLKWQVTAGFSVSFDPSCGWEGITDYAVWESEPFDTDDCLTLPKTCNLVSSQAEELCLGTWPATVTVN